MSTPAQSIGALMVTCEKCGRRVHESELVVVVDYDTCDNQGPEYIEQCADCDRKDESEIPY